MHSKTGTLKAVEPFEFRRSLDFVRGFGPMSGQQGVGEGSVTKAIMVDGQVIVLRVEGGDGPELGYRLFSAEPMSQEVDDYVARQASFFLSLEDDVKPFYSIAREKDPKFYPLVDRAWGLHQVKFLTFLEIACWALINQRMQRTIALRIKQSLTERFGGRLEVEGTVYWAFPDRSRFEKATVKELLEVTRNQRITQRLVSLASSLDDLDEKFLRTALYDKARERLEKVNGIGEWSSMFILFRGLGRMGKLQPINLKQLGGEVERVYGTAKPLKEINETYRDWAGYWQLYLWASTMAGFKSP